MNYIHRKKLNSTGSRTKKLQKLLHLTAISFLLVSIKGIEI